MPRRRRQRQGGRGAPTTLLVVIENLFRIRLYPPSPYCRRPVSNVPAHERFDRWALALPTELSPPGSKPGGRLRADGPRGDRSPGVEALGYNLN
jgi:hypothetical protein